MKIQTTTQGFIYPSEISWKLTFWKQTIMPEDEIKVSVILANQYKVKAKSLIIPIF